MLKTIIIPNIIVIYNSKWQINAILIKAPSYDNMSGLNTGFDCIHLQQVMKIYY